MLTLEEAINIALEANRSVLDARDRVENARLSIVSAESEFELKFFPDASAQVTGGDIDGTEENIGAGISVQKRLPIGTVITVQPNLRKDPDSYTSSLDSSILQPLLRGSSREFNLAFVQGTAFDARTSARSLYLTRVNTVISTVGAVYSVIGQREFVRLNQDSVSRLKGHAEAARVKEKFGLATPIDVYRAEIQMKQAQDNLATAQEAYENALDNLRLILAFPIERPIDVAAPLEYSIVRMNEEEAVETALRNRMELRQAWDAARDAERRSRVAKHGILPELNVVLSLSPFGQSPEFEESLHMDHHIWGINLTSTTDLARTAERAAYEQSLLDVRIAYRNLTLRRDEVARDVKSALRNLIKAEQRIEIQREQIRQSEGKLKLAQVKFKHGLANNFDLIEAEEQLRSAQTNLVSVVIDYIVGTYAFRSSIGTLLEQPPGL
ncbi:MAG: TolC family protein [Candidatus Abyssubacteria bacterium]